MTLEFGRWKESGSQIDKFESEKRTNFTGRRNTRKIIEEKGREGHLWCLCHTLVLFIRVSLFPLYLSNLIPVSRCSWWSWLCIVSKVVQRNYALLWYHSWCRTLLYCVCDSAIITLIIVVISISLSLVLVRYEKPGWCKNRMVSYHDKILEHWLQPNLLSNPFFWTFISCVFWASRIFLW